MFKAVIDQQGNYIEFIEVKNNIIKNYELKLGERLIDDLGFMSMIKPVYRDGRWIETGTPPTPTPIQKTEEQIKIEKLGQQNTDLEIQNIQQGQKITDLELQNMALGQTVTDLELRILTTNGGNANVK